MMPEPFCLQVKLAPKDIDFLNRVFEAYDNLCVVSTVDSAVAVVKLWGYGKIGPVKRILKGLPFQTEIIEA